MRGPERGEDRETEEGAPRESERDPGVRGLQFVRHCLVPVSYSVKGFDVGTVRRGRVCG